MPSLSFVKVVVLGKFSDLITPYRWLQLCSLTVEQFYLFRKAYYLIIIFSFQAISFVDFIDILAVATIIIAMFMLLLLVIILFHP